MADKHPEMHPDPEAEIQYPTEGFASVAHKINEQLHCIDASVARYTKKPSEKNEHTLESMHDAHITSMMAALKVYRNEFDSDETALKDMMLYVYGLEQRRVDSLNALQLPQSAPYKLAQSGTLDELYEDMLITLQETEDTAIGIVGDHYVDSLVNHTQKLMADATLAYESRPSLARSRSLRRLGGHALDVAKVAVGTAIGAGVVHYTMRRRAP